MSAVSAAPLWPAVRRPGRNWAVVALLVLALLPYIRTSPLESDVQPHFFLAVLIYLVTRAAATGRLPVHPASLALSLYLGTISLYVGDIQTSVLMFFMPLVTDIFARQNRVDIQLALKIVTVIMLAGVVLQVISPQAITSMVSNHRTSLLRGFTSFTSEPSYLGIVGLTLTGGFLAFGGGRLWLGAACVLVALSGSATALLPLVVILGAAGLRGWRLVLVPIGLALAYFLALEVAETNTRLGRLLMVFLDKPELLLLDESVSNRVTRAAGPIVQAAEDWFVPHRFDEYIVFDHYLLSDRANVYIDRLSSLGTILAYSYGFLALPVFVVYGVAGRAPLFVWLLVAYMVFTNISAATPYLLFVLALPFALARDAAQDGSGPDPGAAPP